MPSVSMLSVFILSTFMPNDIILSVIMHITIVLSIMMQSVFMLSVVMPFCAEYLLVLCKNTECHYAYCCCTEHHDAE